jgi:exopolyphosphatase/guanosine-5'-triphosphate,3'-diphosphate pyrophosphatase
MKLAIIDLGTNTFTLLIAQIKAKQYNVICKNKVAVKLGEDGIDKGIIEKKAFKRGLDAIEQHKKIIDLHAVDKVIAFATSAIRSTSNGNQFRKEVFKLYGIEIEVIDGNREADYIYHGVKQALDLGNDNCLIMDIGGGSTEFIIANKNEIFWKKSFQLGVSRLKEKLKPNDPIQKKDIDNLNDFFDCELKSLFQAIKKYEPITLVGSSGSFDSLATMIGYEFLDKDVLLEATTFDFKIDNLNWANQYLIKSDYQKRKKIKGISKMRAKMIVIASIFVQYIIEKSEIKNVKLSTFSLKEGVVFMEINN